jgi:hypothetical protein
MMAMKSLLAMLLHHNAPSQPTVLVRETMKKAAGRKTSG